MLLTILAVFTYGFRWTQANVSLVGESIETCCTVGTEVARTQILVREPKRAFSISNLNIKGHLFTRGLTETAVLRKQWTLKTRYKRVH